MWSFIIDHQVSRSVLCDQVLASRTKADPFQGIHSLRFGKASHYLEIRTSTGCTAAAVRGDPRYPHLGDRHSCPHCWAMSCSVIHSSNRWSRITTLCNRRPRSLWLFPSPIQKHVRDRPRARERMCTDWIRKGDMQTKQPAWGCPNGLRHRLN